MKNVLKFALLVIGAGLLGYGLFTLVSPQVSINTGPIAVEAREDNTQAFAMMAFGLLTLLGGLAFGRR